MPDLLTGIVNGPVAIRTSEGIAQIIRRAILGGHLAPGTQLPERKLAEELSVSRTPVREALFVLQGEGLIDLTPGRRARVRQLPSHEIHEIYALRHLLEVHAVRRAAELQDIAKINRIDDALIAQKRLGALASAQEQAQADLAFHEAIAEAAGSPLLLTLLRQVLAVTVSYRSAQKYTNAHMIQVFRQHGAVVDAIRASAGDRAEREMSQHILKSSELMLKETFKTQSTPKSVARMNGTSKATPRARDVKAKRLSAE
ncbi:MAG: GntR family transcriptional regulator [Bradyrhizobium sp.]|nr:GntR family transcriptional regulator [Bradyrhizobium sp.]